MSHDAPFRAEPRVLENYTHVPVHGNPELSGPETPYVQRTDAAKQPAPAFANKWSGKVTDVRFVETPADWPPAHEFVAYRKRHSLRGPDGYMPDPRRVK